MRRSSGLGRVPGLLHGLADPLDQGCQAFPLVLVHADRGGADRDQPPALPVWPESDLRFRHERHVRPHDLVAVVAEHLDHPAVKLDHHGPQDQFLHAAIMADPGSSPVTPAQHHGQPTSAHAVRWPRSATVAPVRSVTPATMARPQPLPGTAGPAAGPSSATSILAHCGAARIRTVKVPPRPLAECSTALLASSVMASIRSVARGQPGSAPRTNRRATGTDDGSPGSVAVNVSGFPATTRCIRLRTPSSGGWQSSSQQEHYVKR